MIVVGIPTYTPLLFNCEAAIAFLLDLQGKTTETLGWSGGVRWGPLLAFAWMHNCRFAQNPAGYVEPTINAELYQQLASDALDGIQQWLPRLGLERVHRPPKILTEH